MNIQDYNLFSTNIRVIDDVDLDLEELYARALNHAQTSPSVKLSNSGYQGHGFEDAEIKAAIRKSLPERPDKPIKDFDLQIWINFNNPGDWNDVHNHIDKGVFLSGVLYVKAPKDCGNIRIYDPRGFNKSDYSSYYEEERGNYLSIPPKDGMMLFFPPYLLHSVEPNMSGQTRLSIAFNVLNFKF